MCILPAILCRFTAIACVTSDKERENHTEDTAFRQPSREESYAHLPSGNDRKLKDVTSCKPVFIPRNKLFWVAVPCDWVTAS